MPRGCRRLRRPAIACGLLALVVVPGAIVTASSAHEPAPRATATARISLLVPDARLRSEIVRHCRADATVGYVPIARVRSGTPGVPPEGRFVRCPSGATVFLVPTSG